VSDKPTKREKDTVLDSCVAAFTLSLLTASPVFGTALLFLSVKQSVGVSILIGTCCLIVYYVAAFKHYSLLK